MRPAIPTILTAALVACAVTAVAIPATAGSTRSMGDSTGASSLAVAPDGPSQSAPSPQQNPCFTQLRQDLKECEEEFCPNVFSCNEEAHSACIYGAKASFESCLKGNN